MGPMKAEKSTSAVRIARKFGHFCNVLLVNSAIDQRHKGDFVVMHSGSHSECVKVSKLSELEDSEQFQKAQLVVIDEGQFFSDLKEHVIKHRNSKSYVVASLDSDAKQNKFGQIWDLIPYATSIEKLHALCEVCRDGTSAICTIRIGHFNKQISVDNLDGDPLGPKYMSVCIKHLNHAENSEFEEN